MITKSEKNCDIGGKPLKESKGFENTVFMLINIGVLQTISAFKRLLIGYRTLPNSPWYSLFKCPKSY